MNTEKRYNLRIFGDTTERSIKFKGELDQKIISRYSNGSIISGKEAYELTKNVSVPKDYLLNPFIYRLNNPIKEPRQTLAYLDTLDELFDSDFEIVFSENRLPSNEGTIYLIKQTKEEYDADEKELKLFRKGLNDPKNAWTPHKYTNNESIARFLQEDFEEVPTYKKGPTYKVIIKKIKELF